MYIGNGYLMLASFRTVCLQIVIAVIVVIVIVVIVIEWYVLAVCSYLQCVATYVVGPKGKLKCYHLQLYISR